MTDRGLNYHRTGAPFRKCDAMPKTRTRPASKFHAWSGWAVVPTPREPIEIFSRDYIVEQEAEQWLGDLLESWSIQPAARAQVEVVLHELLSNATEFGSGSIQVEVQRRAGRIRIGVRDDGQGPMRTGDAFPPHSGAHGLGRVAKLSHVWGVTRHPGGGATVWAELDP